MSRHEHAGNSFYSFRSGLSHTIFLNPYTRADPKSEQYKWLVAELVGNESTSVMVLEDVGETADVSSH